MAKHDPGCPRDASLVRLWQCALTAVAGRQWLRIECRGSLGVHHLGCGPDYRRRRERRAADENVALTEQNTVSDVVHVTLPALSVLQE